MIHIARVYDHTSPELGRRILVDRLWPRGLKKEDAHIDLWLKEVAPSTELRVWYGHDPVRFDAFAGRYRQELAVNPAFEELWQMSQEGPLCLLTSKRDREHTHTLVLKEALLEKSGQP